MIQRVTACIIGVHFYLNQLRISCCTKNYCYPWTKCQAKCQTITAASMS